MTIIYIGKNPKSVEFWGNGSILKVTILYVIWIKFQVIYNYIFIFSPEKWCYILLFSMKILIIIIALCVSHPIQW